MANDTHISRAQAADADRVFEATRSASMPSPSEPSDGDEAAAARAAHVKALEEEFAYLEHRGNPRAEQVRVELSRVRRHLSAA